MRRFGYPVALAGSVLGWLGFAMLTGWLAAPLILEGSICAAGIGLNLWAGFLTNRPVARGFAVSAFCFLADALLIWQFVPRMVDAGSGQDGVVLASIVGAGTSLFFGMALLIAAGMASLFSQK